MATFRDKSEDIAAEANDEQKSHWEDIEQPTAEYTPKGHHEDLSATETLANEKSEPDGLEAGTIDIGSDSGKKRVHGKQQ